ncbi:MAG: citrate:proton symporter [Sporomusaceae bacterium]|nr:citrate:proton symporter [Sporomusaceae bacterium]
MITVLAYAMIITFLVLLTKRKLNVFAALIIVPIVFGLTACLYLGKDPLLVFQWVKNGLFYTINPQTKAVKMGVMSGLTLILFAVLYFGIMLKAGLFDPLCIFFIKKAKGDPLKIALATVMVSSMVTLDGDTTTTIVVCTSALLPLWRRMRMNLAYLAILITMPIGIFNQLPWGGPLVANAIALGVDMGQLFTKILPGMLVAEVYVIGVAYWLGRRERSRLSYDPAHANQVTPAQIEEMVSSVKNFEPDFKRPRYFFFNLALTVAVVGALIADLAHGGVLFMTASAIALSVNYGLDEQMDLIRNCASDVLIPSLATFAASAFTGILAGSGMSTAIANSIIAIIPQSLGVHMAPIYALIAAPAICFLPQDAFYFGIAAIIAPVANQLGISTEEAAVASMVGQAWRLASPVIPALYLLCERCELNFVEYQKLFFIWTWPILFIYLFMHVVTGAMPF